MDCKERTAWQHLQMYGNVARSLFIYLINYIYWFSTLLILYWHLKGLVGGLILAILDKTSIITVEHVVFSFICCDPSINERKKKKNIQLKWRRVRVGFTCRRTWYIHLKALRGEWWVFVQWRHKERSSKMFYWPRVERRAAEGEGWWRLGRS